MKRAENKPGSVVNEYICGKKEIHEHYDDSAGFGRVFILMASLTVFSVMLCEMEIPASFETLKLEFLLGLALATFRLNKIKEKFDIDIKMSKLNSTKTEPRLSIDDLQNFSASVIRRSKIKELQDLGYQRNCAKETDLLRLKTIEYIVNHKPLFLSIFLFTIFPLIIANFISVQELDDVENMAYALDGLSLFGLILKRRSEK